MCRQNEHSETDDDDDEEMTDAAAEAARSDRESVASSTDTDDDEETQSVTYPQIMKKLFVIRCLQGVEGWCPGIRSVLELDESARNFKDSNNVSLHYFAAKCEKSSSRNPSMPRSSWFAYR